jgi:hypothetical protein
VLTPLLFANAFFGASVLVENVGNDGEKKKMMSTATRKTMGTRFLSFGFTLQITALHGAQKL